MGIHRVVSTLIGEWTDAFALARGDLIGPNYAGRIAGTRSSDRVVVGRVETIAQSDLRPAVLHGLRYSASKLCHVLPHPTETARGRPSAGPPDPGREILTREDPAVGGEKFGSRV